VTRWRDRRGRLVVPAALLLAALVLFWPLFLHRQHLVPFHVLAGDPALQGIDRGADRPDWRTYDLSPLTTFYAEKGLAASALRNGELPLWNPYNGLGMPLLADGQSQPLSPFFLPFLAAPSPWVYSFCLLVHLLFGGLGADRLLARLGCGPWARAFGALAFAFNPYTLKFMAYSDVWGYVFLPWLFLAAEFTLSGGARSGVGLAVAMAVMACCGHPEEALFGACASVLYLLLRGWGLGVPFHRLGAKALWIPLLAAALSAWWAVPFAEWASLSWSPRLETSTVFTYGASALFISGSELLWLPLMLSLAVAGATRSRTSLALLPVFVLAVLLLFPFPVPLQKVLTLGFMSGRYVRSIAWFIIVVWTALGMERWARGGLGAWKWGGAALQLAWVAAALFVRDPAVAGGRVPLSGGRVLQQPSAWILLGAGLILWLLPSRDALVREGYRYACLVAVLLAGVLLPPLGGRPLWNRSAPSLAPAVAQVRPQGDGRQWFPSSGGFQILSPDLSALWGVRDVRTTAPAIPRRLAPLAGELEFGYRGLARWEPQRLEAAGVSVGWKLEGNPARLVPSYPDEPVSRGFWVGQAGWVKDASSATELALDGAAWRETVFLEGREARPTSPPPGAPSHASVSAAAVADGLNSTVWEVTCPADGWFVLRDLYWPGWRASVDGQPAPVVPADGAFRAVKVSAGHHRIKFAYLPLSLVLGAAVSAVAWALVLWSWSKRARRRERRHATA
jgi:hypothetical protein